MKAVPQYVGLLAFLLNLSLASRLQKRDCAANDCIRAVRGQGKIASSDCSSYLKSFTAAVTVTPGLGQGIPTTSSSQRFGNERNRLTITSTSTETILAASTEIVTTTVPYTYFDEVYTGVRSTIVVTTIPTAPPAASLARRAHNTVPSMLQLVPKTYTSVPALAMVYFLHIQRQYLHILS
jgi:hypothetical protein